MQKSTLLLLAKLFALSFGILFLLSPDSYTHDIFRPMDTSWLFSCCKVWMNDLTHNVNIADSKEPLVGLFYVNGYLVSHFKCICFWGLIIFLFTSVFYYVNRIAQHFIKDYRMLLFVTTLLSYFYQGHFLEYNKGRE